MNSFTVYVTCAIKKLLFHVEMAVDGLSLALGVAFPEVPDIIGELCLGAIDFEINVPDPACSRAS